MWMQGPAMSFVGSNTTKRPSILSNGDDSGNEYEDSSAEENDMVRDMVVTEEIIKDHKKYVEYVENDGESFVLDYQPIPPGSKVSTIYGEGTIVKYRKLDKLFVITLDFGTAYLRPNALLCTIMSIERSSLTNQLRQSDNEPPVRNGDMLMLGPQSLYIFFRLHQVLIRRLNIARSLSYSVDKDSSLNTVVEKLSVEENSDIGLKRYEAYLSLVYALVEGGCSPAFSASAAEGGKYEDRVRCLLGHGAYELATMDKLIGHILKNLQLMANEEILQNMIQVYRRHLEAGSFKPAAFRQEAAFLSEGENMFAFQYGNINNADNSIMHIEFLGAIAENEDEEVIHDMVLTEADDRNEESGR